MSTYKITPIQHSWAGSDKSYTAEEKAKEKKYNHEYYMKNKEKWGVKMQEYTKGDSDFDSDDNYDEKNRVGNSDFFAFKNKDGRWVITEEDMKWVLPEGVEPDAEMRKQLEAFKGFQDPSIKTHEDWDEAVNSIINKGKKQSGSGEFDIDAAAKDIIRGKYGNGKERKEELGDDYEAVQKRVNELLKGTDKTSSTKKEEEKKLVSEKEHESTSGDKLKTILVNKDLLNKKSNVKHSYTVITEDDELYHHGIIGQKWGVRRFQNSNGSLTAEGRQRYSGKSKSTVENPPAVVKTKNSSKLSSEDVNKILNESGNIARKSDNTSKSINKIKKSEEAKKKDQINKEKYKDASEMSDKELREFLNRYDMEQRYNRIVNENKKDILSGSEVAKEILNVTKDVAAVAVSAATIYSILNSKK